MPPTATATDLSQWNGKRVTVVRNLEEPDEQGNSTIEVKGLVQVGNDMGLLIKPKGKVTFDLISAAEIEEVFLTPEGDKKFVASKIKPIEDNKVRRHLLDRHGVTLEWANSVTEEGAKVYHDSIDHKTSNIGHIHVTEADKAAEAAAEPSAESDEAAEA